MKNQEEKGFIVYFTGTSLHGKTTLAYLIKSFMPEAFVIDELDIDKIYKHFPFRKRWEESKMATAQNLAEYLFGQGKYVIVSMANPFKNMREDFKKRIGNRCLEVYVRMFAPNPNETDQDKIYEPPEDDFLLLETDSSSPIDCVKKIINQIEIRLKDER